MKLFACVALSSVIIKGCASTGGGQGRYKLSSRLYTPIEDTKGIGQERSNTDLME